MDCEDFMRSFLNLDNREALPPALEEHRKNCRGPHGKNCAQLYEELLRLMESRAVYGNIPPEKDIVPAVMARIASAESAAGSRSGVSTGNWIGTGLLILAGMCLIPFSTILPALALSMPWLSITLPLVLGSVITIYAMLFTGSHMKALSRFFGLRQAPRM